jgi:dihydrofolate reductase
MRRAILGLAVSLDGFIEDAAGACNWCFTDQDYGMTAFLNDIDTVFIGRKTFEITGGNPFPKKTCYVFSNTLTNVPAGVQLITGDIAEQVNNIKSGNGKDIWLFGGAGITTSFLQRGLIDVIQLAIHPLLLGRGKSLLAGSHQRVNMELLQSKTYFTRLVSLSYQVMNT